MWVWDSAFGLESRIAAARLCDRRSSLISALALQSHDSISKILESCAKLPPNLRKILESSGVVRKLTFFVIASGVSRAAIHFKKVDSMDCHDFASAKSRNDRNLFFQQDSRLASKAPNLNKQAKDSKICDEKAGLRSLLRGDKTSGLSHKQKANSLLYRAKLNLPKEQKWI